MWLPIAEIAMIETQNADLINQIDEENMQSLQLARSQPKIVLEKGFKTLEEAQKANYTKGVGEANAVLGAAHLWLSKYDEALEYCIEAEQILYDFEAYRMLGKNQYTIGTIFFYLSDYNNALSAYIKALKFFEQAKDPIGEADAYNGIGSVYYAMDENLKAIQYLSKSKALCEEHEAYEILQKVMDGFGQAYINTKKYDEALVALNEGIQIIEQHTQNEHVKAHSFNKLGTVFHLRGNYDTALEYFEKSLALRKKAQFKTGQAACLANIGATHHQLNNFKESQHYLEEALDLAREVNARDVEASALIKLSKLSESLEKDKEALAYYKEYHHVQQLLKSENADRRAKSIELKFKIEQEQQEKVLLEEQNEQLKKYSEDLVTLGEIGQSLTSLLSAEKIIAIAHEKVSKLLDATSFGLGIYNEEKNQINFPGYIENGKTFKNIEYDVKEDGRLVNICFLHKKEIFINDFENEYHQYISNFSAPKAGKNTASIIYLPFEIPNGTSGVITVQSFEKNAYKDHHVNILRNLSIYMAIAFENAQLYQNLEQKVEDRTEEIRHQKEEIEKSYQITSVLSEIGKELTSSTDFDTIFLKLHKHVSDFMDAACFGVRLYKPEENEIEYKFEIEKGEVDEEPFSVSMEDVNNYSVICVKNQQVIHINDNLNEYQKYTKEIVVPSGEMPHSLIFYPMNIGDRVIGLITVQSFQKFAFTEQHLDILKTLSAFTAIALDNVNILENLEKTVADRTAELLQQKEEIEKTYQNAELLKEIGREIISSLSIPEIIEKMYENTNQLMDSSIIGIGIANEEKNRLEIKGAFEEGKKLPDFHYDIDGKESLTTWCYKNRKEIIINNYNEDIGKYLEDVDDTKVGKRPESIIYVPLQVKGKIIGTFSIQSFKENAYSNYHLNILRNLALYAATAIENANLYREVEKKVEERTAEVVKQKEEIERTYQNTRLLSKIGQEIISTHNLESIFEKMHENVNKLMDATCFSIRICDYETNTIEYKYTIEKGKRLPTASVSLDDIDNYSVWCVKNKKEIFITDHEKDYKKYTKKIVVVAGELPDSLIFCPMIVKGKVVGVISAQSFEKHAYQEYHLDILRSLATYSAIALENANLIQNMEDEVKARTAEVVSQKEEIEKSYENTKLLSEIGKEISAELSSENIIEKVYNNLNNLMDATIFGIAIYRQTEEDLFFSGAMEKGEKLQDFSYPATDEKIAGKCFNSGEEIIINDWKKEYHKYISSDYSASQGGMPESMIYLPLISKNNKIGVLTVQSFVKESYQDYHLNILRTLSIYIASALENANLYKDMENRVKERTKEIEKAYQDTKLLSQISKDIAESLEVETIISQVYNNINNLMDATCFGIGLYDEDKKRIIMPGFIEDGNRMEDFFYNLEDERLATWCFKNKKEIFISNYQEEYTDYIKGIQKPVSGKDSTSIIYLPLFLKDRVVGLLTVQSFKKNVYSEYHLDLLKSLASPIATALENARLYQNMEEEVRTRTAEVVQQKEIIEEKNKDITDSIRYAQRIQSVILPPKSAFEQNFDNSFVYFKPRDIVSGDFYWMERVDSKVYLTVVDCTGHGVPGALVSLVGANGLNRCLVEFGLRKPADILTKLSEIVTTTFAKSDSEVKDGMDMALCCLDTETNVLEYAGANNPLWVIRGSEGEKLPYKTTDFEHLQLIEVKADKQPIGHYIDVKPFTNHTIQLYPDDRLYMFSDGYADQFGGLDEKTRMKGGKKFKYSNLKKLMIEVQKMTMEEQRQFFDKRFEKWRGDFEQIDDVCIIGVRV